VWLRRGRGVEGRGFYKLFIEKLEIYFDLDLEKLS